MKPNHRKWRRCIFKWFFVFGALIFVFGFDYYVLSFERVSNPPLPTQGLAHELMETVKVLAQPEWEGRKPKTEGNRKAADWIEEQMKVCGLRSFDSLGGYRQRLPHGIGDNLVGFRSAKEKTDRWIVIGAHFDHVGREGFFNRPHLGADDNASAVAILLRSACMIQSQERSNLVFVAYNSEEPPYFLSAHMGSASFVENLPSEISKVSLSVTMDLMGGAHWRPLMNALMVVGGRTGTGLTDLVKQARADGLNVAQLDYHAIERLPLGERSAVSDYVPFLQAKIPSLFLSVGRTPRYHDTADTYETLDYNGMAMRTHWLIDFLKVADTYDGRFTHADAADYALEKESIKPFIEKASKWATRVPAASFFVIRSFARDFEKLNQTLPPDEERILIEKAVQRFQCAMMNIPICALL